jgi:hypothetical protein
MGSPTRDLAQLSVLDEFFERDFVIPKPDPLTLKDPVRAQLEAYNEHDIGKFISCFGPEVEFVDSEGELILVGHRDLFRVYSGLFKEGVIQAKAKEIGRIGSHVIHFQVVEGLSEKPEEVILIYTIKEGLIRRTRFYR